MASVADLVEPLVLLPTGVPVEVRDGAEALRVANAVTLDHVGPLSVTANVADTDGAHRVALGATRNGLASSCDCLRGSSGRLCSHSLATAIETWHRAPKRHPG
jgi:hypothetical protein